MYCNNVNNFNAEKNKNKEVQARIMESEYYSYRSKFYISAERPIEIIPHRVHAAKRHSMTSSLN